MRTSALWFGIVAIALAVSPAAADRKVDWSQYIDQRAVANANAPQAAPASEPVAAKPTKKTAKATKAKQSKAKARAAKKKARRK